MTFAGGVCRASALRRVDRSDTAARGRDRDDGGETQHDVRSSSCPRRVALRSAVLRAGGQTGWER